MASHEEQKPPWLMFNEVCSMVESSITTADMLPMYQARADDIDTLTTVVNIPRNTLEENNCVIFLGQPLYNPLYNPSKYFDVEAMVGGLQIMFNYLKVIGLDVNKSGIEESGIFVAKTTQAMMNGKSYKRAVRFHTLAYEA